jgi:hypothetical protein
LIFRDQETGIERHLLSPSHLDTGIEVVENVLPSGQRFPGSPRLGMTVDKYVVVIEGTLSVEIGGGIYDLKAADSGILKRNKKVP